MDPQVALPTLYTEGEGKQVLFVHGSAADRTTWSIQVAGLRRDLQVMTYDRRVLASEGQRDPDGAGQGRHFITVEEHAEDARRLLRNHATAPVVACGSSFGGVVVLELLRRYPGLLTGAVLIEPPLASSDLDPPVPTGFMDAFNRVRRESGGPAAAELFLRAVLGDEAFERIPARFQERSKALHEAIRQDCEALAAYPPRYASLSTVDTPVLLLGGERSLPIYRRTLEALRTHLPASRLEVFSGAGHMLHAEAFRRFNERLRAFIAECSAE